MPSPNLKALSSNQRSEVLNGDESSDPLSSSSMRSSSSTAVKTDRASDSAFTSKTAQISTTETAKNTDGTNAPWRPSAIYTTLVRYSPRLIGWFDDDFRELFETARRQRQEAIEEEKRRRREYLDAGDDGTADGTSAAGTTSERNNESIDGLEDDFEFMVDTLGPTLAEKAVDYFWKSQLPQHTHTQTIQDIKQEDIQKMKAYNTILNSVKHQRDTYIMGTNYASRRKQESEFITNNNNNDNNNNNTRETSSTANITTTVPNSPSTTPSTTPAQSEKTTTSTPNTRPPPLIDPQSLAFTHLTPILQRFIPSPTAHASLLPHFLYTIAPPLTPPYNLPEGGPIHQAAKRALIDLVPLSQPIVDAAAKASMVQFLGDDYWRRWVKESAAGGVVSRMQRDDGRRGKEESMERG